MAEKKKPESMLTRQRRLLREQRAKKAAAKRAKQASTKSLPPKGKSTASSTRARIQRGARRDAMAKKQLENFGRAFKKTLKQGAAQSKLNKAAKGTKGTTVRTAQGKGELVKRSTTKPASTRIQRVKIKVDPPKQLKGSSPNQPKLTKAKPAKLPAGAERKALPPAKNRPIGRASAKRAQAAAKAVRAAQGTKSPTVRQGQPAGAANRYYGADRVGKAVKRAQRSAVTQKVVKTLGGAGRLLAGRDDGSGSALQAALIANSLIDAARGSTAKERSNKGKTKSKTPTKRGVSNIPKAEQYVNNPNYGKPGTPSTPKASTPKLKPAGKVSAATKPKPKKKPSLKEAAYAKDARNREYDRLRKAGKIKEAEALGKQIFADMFGSKYNN